MSYSKKIKEQAIALRREGLSIIQIARKLGIAKSTTSLWVRDIPLSENILSLIKQRELKGREKGRAVMAGMRKLAQLEYEKEAQSLVNKMIFLKDKNILKILCTAIFWCEGSKRTDELRFTNSDPTLIKLFLHSLRLGFDIDESKFRALVHVHEYHNPIRQNRFWSQVTNIPLSQFNKPYLKPHTGIRKRDGYQGCIAIRYGDAKVAKRITALYYALVGKVGA